MLTEAPESRRGRASDERPVAAADQSGLASEKDHPNEVQSGPSGSQKPNCASNSGPALRPTPATTAVRCGDLQRRGDQVNPGRENGLSADHQ